MPPVYNDPECKLPPDLKKRKNPPVSDSFRFWVPFSKMITRDFDISSFFAIFSKSFFGISMVYSLQQFRHLLQSYWGKISSCSRLNCLSSSFSSAHIFKKVRNIQFSSSCFSAASLTLFGSIILICTSFSASEISVSKFPAAETWIGGPDSLILSENRLTRHPNEKFPAWF